MLIEGDLEFKDPFKNTLFPGCVKFKFSEELKKREPKFSNITQLMGAAVLPDGFANMRITGTLGNLRWKAKLKCKVTDPDPLADGDSGRPSISVSKPDPDAPGKEPPSAIDGPAASGPLVSDEGKDPVPTPEPEPPSDTEPDKPVADTPPDGSRLRRTDDVQPSEPPPDEGPENDNGNEGEGEMDPSGAPVGDEGTEPPEPEQYP
jgi:hypothetical protein